MNRLPYLALLATFSRLDVHMICLHFIHKFRFCCIYYIKPKNKITETYNTLAKS